MNESKMKAIGTGKSSRQVFRLSPSLHFPGPERKGSLFFTLRARLIFAFLLVAMTSSGLQAYFNYRNMETTLRNNANQSLYSAAQQTASAIDIFLNSHISAINKKGNVPVLVNYLALSPEKQGGSFQERFALNLLNSAKTEEYSLNNNILAYLLMNKDGKVILNTSAENPGQNNPYLKLDKADPDAFKKLMKDGKPFVSPVIFQPDSSQISIYFVARVYDEKNQTLGFILSRYKAAVLQSLLDQNNNLAGKGSYPVILDENGLRLAQGKAPESVYQLVTPLDASRVSQLKQSWRLRDVPPDKLSTSLPDFAQVLASYSSVWPYFTSKVTGEKDEENAGAMVNLQNKNWLVAYLEPQSVLLAPVQRQALNSALLALGAFAGTIILAIFITGRLTRPISELTRVAGRVAAGDLWIQANEGRDEIGLLASEFNAMTTKLRRTLEGLEQRVAERTSELAHASEHMRYRANQLQTVAELAHAIASVQDPDLLLQQVTELISQRFGYYHVGIFLLDNEGKYAVLQAANSEGGQQLLARGHKLEVGQVGMVGFVTAQGKPRVASDVDSDQAFFNNPDLPTTRSELTVPLKLGDRMIGALDVQSEKPSAFSNEDVSMLGTLADQVAIAIENTRLYTETRSALDELQALHSQYLQKEWAQVAADNNKSGFKYLYGKTFPLPAGEQPEMWSSVDPGKPTVVVNQPGENGSISEFGSNLLVPITVRGQIIGVLNLGQPEGEEHLGWSDEDINLIKATADQIGLALENARLIEQTQRRAEREHLVSDISTKLRFVNDPQAILQVAVLELQKALRVKDARIVVQPFDPFPGNGNEPAPADVRGES